MSLFKRGHVWQYDFWHEGKRFQGTTGKENKLEAQVFEDEVKRNNGKRPHHPRGEAVEPGIYFLQSPLTKLVKIGCSANMTKRIAQYRTENPEKLFLMAKVPAIDYLDAEKQVHHFLKPFREKGEWFEITQRHIEAALLFWMTGHPALEMANIRKIAGKIPLDPERDVVINVDENFLKDPKPYLEAFRSRNEASS